MPIYKVKTGQPLLIEASTLDIALNVASVQAQQSAASGAPLYDLDEYPEYRTRGTRRVKIVVEGDVMFYGESDRYAEVMKLNLEGGGSIPSMKDREVTVLVEQTAPELRVDSMTREGIQQQLDDHYGAGTFVVHEFS